MGGGALVAAAALLALAAAPGDLQPGQKAVRFHRTAGTWPDPVAPPSRLYGHYAPAEVSGWSGFGRRAIPGERHIRLPGGAVLHPGLLAEQAYFRALREGRRAVAREDFRRAAARYEKATRLARRRWGAASEAAAEAARAAARARLRAEVRRRLENSRERTP